jgi:4-alpha-glucanotransferase
VRSVSAPAVLHTRQTGILLHPSSLPGPFGIGDLGPEARRFVDWVAAAGARLWQVLPLCPPVAPVEDCPYASWSALAGNPHLLSLEALRDDGLLASDDLVTPGFAGGWVDYERVLPWKAERLRSAADRLLAGGAPALDGAFHQFRKEAQWAEDTALFAALRDHHGCRPWWRWPEPLRHRADAALGAARRTLAREIDRGVALQFLFERQWAALRSYARQRSVSLLGDVPIYVYHDSVDVWTFPAGFRLQADGTMRAMTGAPPDELASDGQLWGGPLYDWARMADDDYAWWRRRIARALAHADAVRIDHFRALSAAWEIPAGGHPREGRWTKGPGTRFFDALERHLGALPLCVEDLGAMDGDAIALRESAGFPGMRILHYAFDGGADNPHLPHNHPEDALVYPGNHDNDTTVGWWASLAAHVRTHVQHYLGRDGHDIAWDLNRAALASPARLAILQMQDVLALGSEARMNDPASYARPRSEWRNWRWRLLPGQASLFAAERLHFLSSLYGRIGAS